MKVFVYFNLRKKVFSVKYLEGETRGLVIAHRSELTILNARFKVSEAGRQRVLRQKRKNVHAGIVGDWQQEGESFSGTPVTYNPYKFSTFVTLDGHPVHEASKVHLKDRKISAQLTGMSQN